MPQLVISLGRRYVQHINRGYRRTGALWDSRYKPSVVQAETCLLACQRYIELNPVRAVMVEYPAHYRWSSYRSHALGQASTILTPHPLYLALAAGPTQRQAAYRGLLRAQLDAPAIDDIRRALILLCHKSSFLLCWPQCGQRPRRWMSWTPSRWRIVAIELGTCR